MRCILSGIEIRRYLSIRTLIAKVVGFISAYVAGEELGFSKSDVVRLFNR
jgi:hypothetical protein